MFYIYKEEIDSISGCSVWLIPIEVQRLEVGLRRRSSLQNTPLILLLFVSIPLRFL